MTYMCGRGYTFKGLLRLVSMRLDQQRVKDDHKYDLHIWRLASILSGKSVCLHKIMLPSLVLRPLPDFISQPWRDKIWEWPGDEATCCPHRVRPCSELVSRASRIFLYFRPEM